MPFRAFTTPYTEEDRQLFNRASNENDKSNEAIHIAVVIVDCRERTSSLPLLVLLKSVLLNRQQLPLHLHFLSDSITSKTIHKLLSTWSIPYFYWTVYSSPQTESIPSLVYGNILLNLFLPTTVNEFIALSIDALVINDLGQLWQSLKRHTSTRVIELNDFESDVLLTRRGNNMISSESIRAILKDYNPKLNHNDVVDMFSELPAMIVPCNIENYVISHQLEARETVAYHKTHHALKYDTDVALLQNMHSYNNRRMNLSDDHTDFCSLMNETAQYKYRTLLHFYGQYYSSSDIHDVTVVTQLTFDRIYLLSLFLSHWTGPASIAIYAADGQLEELYKFVDSTAIINKRARENLAIHVVRANHSVLYPINYIRNVALDSVITPYVFLNDFEMLPNYDSYVSMKKAIKELFITTKKKIALVIPAFETSGNGSYRVPFPDSKEKLIQQLNNNKSFQFHQNSSYPSHRPTLYRKWRNASDFYEIEWCYRYEPYVVVRTNVVRYDTRFVGYGYNKMSHIMELYAQSYTFVVHPFLFVLHEWHPPSLQKKIYLGKNNYLKCLYKLKNSFLKYLKSKYSRNIDLKCDH